MAMTTEQFKHWKDFAIRMARTCFKRYRSPNAKDIEKHVREFFACIDTEELKSIVDWDHSDPYPKGSRYYSRTHRTSCWHCHGTKKPDCPWGCENGQIYDYASAGLVCDTVTEFSDSWNPRYYSALNDSAYEEMDERYCGPVRCCIRAGLDLAVSPSAGVIGFTAGDLRRMYPEGVPDWITGGRGHRWQHAISGKLNGTFAKMADTAGVWL